MTDFADEARDIIRFMDEIYGLEYTDSDKSVAADHIQSALHEAYEAGVKDQILNTTTKDIGENYRIAVEALDIIACWHDGPKVSGMFDEPASAEISRAALAKIQGGKT